MADKKNIVIKVKYPKAAAVKALPKNISQWHYPRIAMALTVLLLIIIAAVYFFKSTSSSIEQETTSASSAPKQNSLPVEQEHSAAPNNNMPASAQGRVTRALLTSDVVKNEPIDQLTLPLKLAKKKPTWIYYFAELNDMKGATVYHEWLLEGQLISRKEVKISEDFWRTASRQVFKYTARNHWTVRLVDSEGKPLNEIPFTVIYK
jgi:hypothetical protein